MVFFLATARDGFARPPECREAHRARRTRTFAFAERTRRATFVILAAAALSACSDAQVRTDPMGKDFPSVAGTNLEGKEVRIPEAFAGNPVLLLVGYEMKSQFDLDRWIVGLTMAKVAVRTIEVPTIDGFFPGLFSGSIDQGMRRGIPEEDWGGVVTVYGDADAIVAFLGDEDTLPGRVVLLDATGRVVFFHDRGFSAGALEKLRAALAALAGPTGLPAPPAGS